LSATWLNLASSSIPLRPHPAFLHFRTRCSKRIPRRLLYPSPMGSSATPTPTSFPTVPPPPSSERGISNDLLGAGSTPLQCVHLRRPPHLLHFGTRSSERHPRRDSSAPPIPSPTTSPTPAPDRPTSYPHRTTSQSHAIPSSYPRLRRPPHPFVRLPLNSERDLKRYSGCPPPALPILSHTLTCAVGQPLVPLTSTAERGIPNISTCPP
jgi:hypothetical protein